MSDISKFLENYKKRDPKGYKIYKENLKKQKEEEKLHGKTSFNYFKDSYEYSFAYLVGKPVYLSGLLVHSLIEYQLKKFSKCVNGIIALMDLQDDLKLSKIWNTKIKRLPCSLRSYDVDYCISEFYPKFDENGRLFVRLELSFIDSYLVKEPSSYNDCYHLKFDRNTGELVFDEYLKEMFSRLQEISSQFNIVAVLEKGKKDIYCGEGDSVFFRLYASDEFMSTFYSEASKIDEVEENKKKEFYNSHVDVLYNLETSFHHLAARSEFNHRFVEWKFKQNKNEQRD